MQWPKKDKWVKIVWLKTQRKEMGKHTYSEGKTKVITMQYALDLCANCPLDLNRADKGLINKGSAF